MMSFLHLRGGYHGEGVAVSVWAVSPTFRHGRDLQAGRYAAKLGYRGLLVRSVGDDLISITMIKEVTP